MFFNMDNGKVGPIYHLLNVPSAHSFLPLFDHANIAIEKLRRLR